MESLNPEALNLFAASTVKYRCRWHLFTENLLGVCGGDNCGELGTKGDYVAY
jgi:hypothetical protein